MGKWLSLYKIDSFLSAPKLVQQFFCRAWVTTLSKVSSCPWTGYCYKRTIFRENKTIFPKGKYDLLPFAISDFTKSFLEIYFSIFWTLEFTETVQYFARSGREGSNFTAIEIWKLNLQSNLSGLCNPRHSPEKVMEPNCIYCSQFNFH